MAEPLPAGPEQHGHGRAYQRRLSLSQRSDGGQECRRKTGGDGVLPRSGGCSVRVPEHDEEDLKVADQAATVWTQFAKTGNPSVEGLVDWPAYTEANNVYLDIGAPLEVKKGIQDSYVAPPAQTE